MEIGFYGNKIKSIQFLRALAIIFVMIEHVSYWRVGAFGVDFFFVISGFVMMYSTHLEEVTKGYRKNFFTFLPQKLLRIIPLYYLMTILTYIAVCVFPQFFINTDKSFVQVIKSFLFIPYESGGRIMPIVKVGWCLNYEVLFYFIFFAAIMISYRFRGLIASVVLIAISIAGFFLQTDSIPVRFWMNDVNLDFVYGIIAYYLCRNTHRAFLLIKKKKAMRVILCVVFILCVCALLVSLISGYRIVGDDLNPYRGISWGIPAFAIFMLIYWIGILADIPKIFVLLGNISFSLFLIHYYPVTICTRVAEETHKPFLMVLLPLVGFAFSLAVSVPVHFLFDKKISGKIAVFLKKN